MKKYGANIFGADGAEPVAVGDLLEGRLEAVEVVAGIATFISTLIWSEIRGYNYKIWERKKSTVAENDLVVVVRALASVAVDLVEELLPLLALEKLSGFELTYSLKY